MPEAHEVYDEAMFDFSRAEYDASIAERQGSDVAQRGTLLYRRMSSGRRILPGHSYSWHRCGYDVSFRQIHQPARKKTARIAKTQMAERRPSRRS